MTEKGNIIGVLVGHTLRVPGVKVNGGYERPLNRSMASFVEARWKEIHFESGIIIDAPNNPGNGVWDRIGQAKTAGVAWAIELHHNAEEPDHPQDYGEILYFGASPRGRQFAEFIKDFCWPEPLRRKYGVQKFRLTALPNEAYGRKDAVEKSPYPAVIFEPAFMSNKNHNLYFQPENFKRFSEHLADCLKAWHEVQETLNGSK